MAGTGWTEGETQALLHVWSDQAVQLKLKAVSKNRTIYEAIARSLTEMGYEKTGGQCKTKIKNLTAKYRRVKDGNRKSGNSLDSSFVYFEEMDAVLGTRAASEPPLLLDSGVPDTIVDVVHGESFSSQINYNNLIWMV